MGPSLGLGLLPHVGSSPSVVLHDSFPRSIRFCVEGVDAALHRISGCERAHFTTDAERLSGKLCSDLNYARIADIFKMGLHQYLDGI